MCSGGAGASGGSGGGVQGPGTVIARSSSNGSGSSSDEAALQEQLHELRQLLAQQQRTIAALERRLAGGQPPAPAVAAAAATCADTPGAHQQHLQHSGGHGHDEEAQQWQGLPLAQAEAAEDAGSGCEPLDGPQAVLQPSVLHRRVVGSYFRPASARYHTTTWGAATRDLSLLPRRIILVRHAESKGNVDPFQYTQVPDPSVPLTRRGWEQAIALGERLHAMLAADGEGLGSNMFVYTSPHTRCKQTTEGLVQAFAPEQLLGVQEEVCLREQDWGNFQDAEGKKREQQERLRFGRFFYRFPHGESGADVHLRMTAFQDHLVRDMDAGRFGEACTLLLVTHGLASRIFLMRWFHWTVEQFLSVWNPGNAQPLVLERIPDELVERETHWMHTKALYRLSKESRLALPGINEDMCETTWQPRGLHWSHPGEASPEDAPLRRQCSVNFQE